MKKSRFNETQIIAILKQADAGLAISDICRQAGISLPTYYQWKSKYGGMNASELKRVKELEAENARLKRMYAELALDWTVQDAEVIAALSALVEDRPSRGFWKCYKLLRRMGRIWNHKRVYRVYKAMRLNLRRAARRRLSRKKDWTFEERAFTLPIGA